jgi:L-fucose isomerase-like protein
MSLQTPLGRKVAVFGLSSPLEVGAAEAPAAAAALAAQLQADGCKVVALGVVDTAEKAVTAGRRCAAEQVEALAAVATSWFEDFLVQDLLEEWSAPLLLWALPGMETGALCGVQQLTCFLKQLDAPYAGVFGSLEDRDCQERARVYLQAAALKARLRRARIGLAGQRIGGMTHTAPNEFMLKKALGPRVVPLDLPLLLQRAAEFSPAETRPLWQQITGRAGACQVPDEAGLDAMGVYLALRELVVAEGLSALTVGCYPHLMGRVCLAASRLADEGIPLACEGDVNGAVGQLLLQLLTGQPTHHTDWLNPLPDGTVVFTHCGSGSLQLAASLQDITLSPVRLMGQGVCALFPAKPGPVTLVNLTPTASGYQMALLEGEARPTEMVFPGNPVRVEFSQPTVELIDWIHEQGLGHHWMVGYGKVGPEIRAWAQLAGPSLQLLCP